MTQRFPSFGLWYHSHIWAGCHYYVTWMHSWYQIYFYKNFCAGRWHVRSLFCRCYFRIFLTELPYCSVLICMGWDKVAWLMKFQQCIWVFIFISLDLPPFTFNHRKVVDSPYSFSFAVYEKIYIKRLLLYNYTLEYGFKWFLRK